MSALREQFIEDGFVLIRNAIPPGLLRELQADLEAILAARDAGKTSADWRHQTLLEPCCWRPSFVQFLNLPATNQAAEAILGNDLSFTGLAVLLGRASHSLCKWHRDFPDNYPETPDLLRHPTTHIQFNGAVFDDRSLWVVPGSHRRPSTQGESAFEQVQKGLPFTGDFAAARALTENPLAAMPGAQHMHLAPGDCLLYNSLIWHSAEYRPQWKRATLHGGWRNAEASDRYEALRWGLEHNPWLMEPAYLGDLGPYFKPQLERYQGQVRKYVSATQVKPN